MKICKHLTGLLLYVFCCAGCTEQPVEQPGTLINLDHLNHLCEEVTIDRLPVEIVHIYAEHPDYRWIEAAGEGISCVDDNARAAIVYLRHYEQNGSRSSQVKLRRLLQGLLDLQAENGLFYNFVHADYSINKTRENSLPIANWWTWRALWALTEAFPLYQELDPVFGEKLINAIDKVLPAVDSLLENYPRVALVNGLEVPAWLPYGAADQTSVLLLGLTAYYRAQPDSLTALRIRRLADGIIGMQIRQPGFFADGALLSWQNIWHAWGNSQAHALITAGMALQDTALAAHGVREVKLFQRQLIDVNFMREIQFVRENGLYTETKRVKFEQIAYDIRPMVMASLAAFESTGDAKYARQAGEIALWLLGKNPAEMPVYDPATGRCFDGINNPTEINRNSGAESTIEALLALSAIERNAIAKAIVNNYYFN